MAVSAMVDRAVESDIDIRFIAQASALGTLADDVVADLIRADEGALALSDSKAIQTAAQLFTALLEPPSTQPTVFPRRSRVSETLRRLTAAQTAESAQGHNDPSGVSRLSAVADALRAAAGDSASADQKTFLMKFFEMMASATMDAAQASLHRRGSATSWLTI